MSLGDPWAVLRAMGEPCPAAGEPLDPLTARQLVVVDLMERGLVSHSDTHDSTSSQPSKPWRGDAGDGAWQWQEIGRLRAEGHSEIKSGGLTIRFAPRPEAAP